MKNLCDFPSPSALVAHLQRHVPPAMDAAHVPGASIAIVRNGTIFCDLTFGLRTADSSIPVTADTLFEAGSISKPVFAYTALALCEQGQLDLDRPLDDYLPTPYLPGDPHVPAITARHVLSHTTGFPNWRPDGELLRTHFTPGSRFSYSGEGYIYLAAGEIAERALYSRDLGFASVSGRSADTLYSCTRHQPGGWVRRSVTAPRS